MKTLKVLKESNNLLELAIANGLLYLLKGNDIPFTLINKESAYLIEIDESVDYDELIFPLLDIEVIPKANNSSLNGKELPKAIAPINEVFSREGNLTAIFNYFETLDSSYLDVDVELTSVKKIDKNGEVSYKTANALSYTSRSYGMGLKGINAHRPKATPIESFKRYLSLIGYLYSSSYVRMDKELEVNAIYIPKKTDDLIAPYFFIGKPDKETGEIKPTIKIIRDSKILMVAELYLLSLEKLNTYFISENYSSLKITTVRPSGNKPLMDKSYELPILKVSNDFLEKCQNIIRYSSLDVKYKFSELLINQDLESFISFMFIGAKDKNFKLTESFLEELISLQIKEVQNLYLNKSVKKIGQALNILISKDCGFSIQAELLNCSSPDDLVRIITNIALSYRRVIKKTMLNDNDINEVLNSVSDTKQIKILANMILIYSSVYIHNKKELEELEELDESEEI